MKPSTTQMLWCLRLFLLLQRFEGLVCVSVKQIYPTVTCYKCEAKREAWSPSSLRQGIVTAGVSSSSISTVCKMVDGKQVCTDMNSVTESGKKACYNTPDLKGDGGALATFVTYNPTKDRESKLDSMLALLPLQPLCFTRLDLVERAGPYPDVTAKERRLVRGGGFPGGSPSECYDASDPSTPKITSKYLFCITPYCNTITVDEMLDRCFKDKKMYLDPVWRSLEVSNNTSAAWSQRNHLTAVSLIAPIVGLRSAFLRAAFIGLIALLALIPLSTSQQSTVMCYTCGNPLKTGIMPPDTDCNDKPLQERNIACPERKLGPNTLGIVLPQTGYCATWLNEEYANYPEKSAGRPLKRWLERGCLYPSGEPDDCLIIDEWAAYPLLKQTYQFCKGQDWCNGGNASTFIGKCLGNTAVASIKSSLNDSDALRNFKYPTPVPVDRVETTALSLTTSVIVDSGDTNQRGNGVSSAHGLVPCLIIAIVMAVTSYFITYIPYV